MSAVLAQRQLSLLAAAVLAVVVGVAVAARDERGTRTAASVPRPAVSDVSGWYSALAGVRTRPLAGRPSGCGTLLGPKTLGVGHSVLPCGARIFLEAHGKTVLTAVVDRGPFTPRYDFELTPALADLCDRKVAKAIEIFGGCLASGRWPEYPARICYADPLPWQEAQFEERQAVSTMEIDEAQEREGLQI